MLLSQILHERGVKMRVRAESKVLAIEEMVDMLIETGEIPMVQRTHIMDAIEDREKALGTGMECGVALPHCATDFVDGIVGAIGIAPHGIDFDSRDGLPADIVILLVIPRRSFQDHIHTVASIARLMRSRTLREAIVAADSPKEVLALIAAEETAMGLVGPHK